MSKLLEEINKADLDIDRLKKDKKILLEKYLEEICPIQIGQKVEVRGYSNQGKMMIVDRRRMVSGFDNNYGWEVSGKVIKKNGSLSKINRGEVAQRHIS